MSASLEEYIKRVVDAAPPLSQAQQDRLRLILAPVVQRLSGGDTASTGPAPQFPVHTPRVPQPAPEPMVLYRFFDKCGCLLYVGITVDFARRHKEHAGTAAWYQFVTRWKTEKLMGWNKAKKAESAAIAAELPAFNVAENVKPGGAAHLAIGYMKRHQAESAS